MDFDINKQRQEENDAMKTPNTMNAIYKEQLSPLKYRKYYYMIQKRQNNY